MTWTLNEAQQHFPDMITAVEQTPQLIYQHNHLVAAVIRADLFQEFLAWQAQQRQLAQVFTELRQLCVDEDYSFESLPRQNRPNPFADLST